MAKYHLSSLLVLLTLLLGLSSSPLVASANTEQPRLLVLPLDDRPANTYYPEKIGQAGGVEIVLPPAELIHYQSSFQSLAAISNWLEETSATVDGFIIAADMLTDGGLVNSRASLQTTNGALNQLAVIETIKNKYPNKPIYVYDTIQRLAPTVLKTGNVEQYKLVRDWAIAYDEVNNLGHMDKLQKLTNLEDTIGFAIIEEYFQTRARNFAVNETLVEMAKNGYIDYLILGQDDAHLTGLHRVEQEKLRAKITNNNLQHKVSIFDGADEVDAILVSRFLATQHDKQPTYKVHYIGVNGTLWTSPFDHYTLQENIEKHITAAGGRIASLYQPADIELYVNTPSSQKDSEIQQAVYEIIGEIRNGKHVVVADVEKVNKANPALAEAIIENVGMTNLLAYSAFNTAGNTIGMAVGQANARFLYLQDEQSLQDAATVDSADHGQVELLLHSISSDHLYRNHVEPKIKWYTNYMGATQWDTTSNTPAVQYYLKNEFHKELDYLHNYIEGSSLLVHKSDQSLQTATVERFSVHDIHLPWNRLFEVSLRFDVKFK